MRRPWQAHPSCARPRRRSFDVPSRRDCAHGGGRVSPLAERAPDRSGHLPLGREATVARTMHARRSRCEATVAGSSQTLSYGLRRDLLSHGPPAKRGAVIHGTIPLSFGYERKPVVETANTRGVDLLSTTSGWRVA